MIFLQELDFQIQDAKPSKKIYISPKKRAISKGKDCLENGFFFRGEFLVFGGAQISICCFTLLDATDGLNPPIYFA